MSDWFESVIGWLSQEQQVIRQAPVTFATSVILSTALLGGAIYYGVKENLSLKNDHIASLQARLSDGQHKEQRTLKHIVRQQFKNETVEVDGKEFNSCRFENVTLLYRGTNLFRLDNSNIVGVLTLKTTHQAALLIEILNDLGFIIYEKKTGGILRIDLHDEI